MTCLCIECASLLQAHNVVVKTEGHMREEPELFNHVDLVQMLGIVDLETGSTVAGTLPTISKLRCGA